MVEESLPQRLRGRIKNINREDIVQLTSVTVYKDFKIYKELILSLSQNLSDKEGWRQVFRSNFATIIIICKCTFDPNVYFFWFSRLILLLKSKLCYMQLLYLKKSLPTIMSMSSDSKFTEPMVTKLSKFTITTLIH